MICARPLHRIESARRENAAPFFGRRQMIESIGPRFCGVTVLGEAKREVPAQAELRLPAPIEIR
jgi:hypothetical protein